MLTCIRSLAYASPWSKEIVDPRLVLETKVEVQTEVTERRRKESKAKAHVREWREMMYGTYLPHSVPLVSEQHRIKN